jgi:transcriptional regulator with XRE-family HTH domain
MENGHPLNTYLKSQGMRAYALASKAGISEQHLSNIIAERSVPSLFVAYKLEQATGRRVKIQQLCPKEWETPKQPRE